MRRHTLPGIFVLWVSLSLCACPWPMPKGAPITFDRADAGITLETAFERSPQGSRDNLRWRRGWALERHLMQALSLSEDEVCQELGQFKCITRPATERPFLPAGQPDASYQGAAIPHLVSLGGNAPFKMSQYRPPPEPGVTTSVALDRVVLAACHARVEKDFAGPASVFTALDLSAGSVSTAESDALSQTLMQRFHLRDATQAEQELVRSLRSDGNAEISARDFALAACLAIGAMSESLFD